MNTETPTRLDKPLHKGFNSPQSTILDPDPEFGIPPNVALPDITLRDLIAGLCLAAIVGGLAMRRGSSGLEDQDEHRQLAITASELAETLLKERQADQEWRAESLSSEGHRWKPTK